MDMGNDLRSVPLKSSRMFYVDYLRATLVILVVLHHIAAVYGAGAPFYYVEPPFTDARAFQVLLVFMLTNQAFFMGALFFLAGYFTPGSYDRKGTASFLKERLIRLGIPLVAFFFILNPVSSIGYYLMPGFLTGITTPLSLREYPELIGLGPLWFVVMLLLFGFGYVVWRKVRKSRPAKSETHSLRPSFFGIGVFVVALAVASYLVRTIVPIGKSVLDFPTLAYLPQYLSFFILGAIAFRRGWLETLSGRKGIIGFAAALVGSVVLFPLAFSGSFFSLTVTPDLNNAMGNGHWRSAVYALWDSLLSVGMLLGLIVLYRRFFNTRRMVGTFLSRHSFAVYIIHIPIIVFLAYALRSVDLSNLTKFGIATVVMVPACFIVAYALRKIPGASKIL
jgi:glucans biosynthesis protein C